MNNSSFKSIKGKSKVIKLRNGESIIDGNSVQTPFLAPYRIPKDTLGKPEPLTLVEYTWSSIENGVEVQRGVKVSGHGELGVPTLKDKETLRALQDIYIWSKIENGVVKLETDTTKITEDDLIIDFVSIDNIATAMGYTRISGQQRKAIKESIERLVATTVFNTHSGGLYDPINKKYITDSKISYNYLDEIKNITTYDCDNCLFLNSCKRNFDGCLDENKRSDVTKIKMSMFLYLTIANNYRLYYNKDNANLIKNLIAKNIYLISRKWIGDGFTSIANIQKYMDRIPMNAKKEKHRKQAIRDGVILLNSYDFVEATIEDDIIKVSHLDKKPTNISLNSSKEIDKIATEELYLRNKYIKFSELREELLKIGFSDEEFYETIEKNIQKIEYFKALLRYVTLKHEYNNTIDKKRYFLNCINAKIDIDIKYYNDLQ